MIQRMVGREFLSGKGKNRQSVYILFFVSAKWLFLSVCSFYNNWLKVAILLHLAALLIINSYSRMLFCQSCFYKNISVDILLTLLPGLLHGMRNKIVLKRKRRQRRK